VGPVRIVVVAPPWYQVPPPAYGGVEAVCFELVQGLVARGHDVTLVGVGSRQVDAAFVPTFVAPLDGLGTPRAQIHELAHAARAAKVIGWLGPDVVHDHTLAGPLTAAARSCPTVATVHNRSHGDAVRFYDSLSPRVSLVALSDRQRRLAPRIPWTDVVHNGIPVDDYPFSREKKRYLLFLGRMCADKGVDLAIDVARAARITLLIAAKCSEPGERAFFDRRIRPRLGEDVRWLGEADGTRKRFLLADARALVAPVRWEEPFGLVAVEALACGTPVVGMRRGAFPEIVREGVTGFLCDRPEELPDAIRRLDSIDPIACRRDAEARFSVDLMVDRYERIYERVTRPEPVLVPTS
jgi:glycosyltransferase involved in cell wall biosynthesis